MIFIPGNVPSLKNSKVMTTIGKGANKRTLLTSSKAVKNYLRSLGIKNYRTSLNKSQKAVGKVKVEEYVKRPNLFKKHVGDYFHGIAYPVVVRFFFVRSTKRRFDFTNAVDIVADLLTAHDFIIDDDMEHFIPAAMRVGGDYFRVDKRNPGVWIKIVGKD